MFLIIYKKVCTVERTSWMTVKDYSSNDSTKGIYFVNLTFPHFQCVNVFYSRKSIHEVFSLTIFRTFQTTVLKYNKQWGIWWIQKLSEYHLQIQTHIKYTVHFNITKYTNLCRIHTQVYKQKWKFPMVIMEISTLVHCTIGSDLF